jgi:hypothetical protein
MATRDRVRDVQGPDPRSLPAVWGGPGKQIDIPFAGPKFHKLEIATRPDGLTIAFDAGDLDQKSSGQVELKLRSADPARLAQALSAAAVR